MLSLALADGAASVGVGSAVAGAGLLHAGWNAAAHRIADRALGFVLIGVAYTVVSGLIVPWFALPRSGTAWACLLASVAVHIGYQLLLMRSYALGDFAQMYPLARGTSPLVVGILAVTVVGQPLTGLDAIGLLGVCAGLGLIAFGGGRITAARRPAIVAAGLTGLTIATYTVLDGVGVRHSQSTGGYIVWLFLLQGPALPIIVALRRGGLRRVFSETRGMRGVGLTSGAVSLLAYGIVIWAQTHANLASVAATRELSILFGAVIGRFAFHERFGAWRIAGSVVTVAGIVVINT